MCSFVCGQYIDGRKKKKEEGEERNFPPSIQSDSQLASEARFYIPSSFSSLYLFSSLLFEF